jgi:MFS family permease
MPASTDVSSAIVRSLIPARMDRLPWTRFHTRLVMSLGTAWILDGLEITLASSVAGVLTASDTLRLSAAAVGAIAAVYLVGQVAGALVFGRLSDALGRRKLFMVTLGVYLFGSGLTAATSGTGPGWVAFLYLTRFIAGAGIGGEYAAINSAIDEMIPARYRGRVDIGVNGTYWTGSIIGTLMSLAFLNWTGPVLGGRPGFLVGPALAVVILYVRRTLPESPRWLLTHGANRPPADRHHRDPAPAGADAESSLLAPPAVGVIQVYPGTIPYIRAVRGKDLPTAVVSSTNTTVNGTDIAVKDVADLLDGTGQPDRNAR